MRKVLVVEDHNGMRHLVRDHLKERGIGVVEAKDAELAFKALHGLEKPDVMILDVMPQVSANLALLDTVRATHPEIPVIVFTGNREIHEHNLVERAHDCVTKSSNTERLVDTVTFWLAVRERQVA